MATRNVITGATGLLGSHIAEHLASRGEVVRALVRASSDTAFLQQLGVELVTGDLQDPASVRRAVAGADVVYHCAARVGDWGPWSDYQVQTVEAARHVVDACLQENVGRLLHVSSISVYGIIKSTTAVGEDAHLGQNLWRWDHYGRAKILAEAEACRFPDHTIVRPSWIYGPRDRTTAPRVIPALLSRKVPLIGSGDNYLNLVYAGDVARGAVLAAQNPHARGEVYNLCSEGEVTQRNLVDALNDALGLPRIQKHVPFALAFRVAFLRECLAKLLRCKKPPRITRRAIYLIGRPTSFSSGKARSHLGWRPHIDIRDGVRRTMIWYMGKDIAEPTDMRIRIAG